MNKLEAQQNLEKVEADRVRLLNLSHLNSSYAFREACAKRVRQINESVKNIKLNLGIKKLS